MPACFSLTRKTEPDAGPVDLNTLDVEICTLVEQPADPDWYCLGWVDAIGYWLAVGESWSDIRARHSKWRTDAPTEPEALAAHEHYFNLLGRIVDWLEENFESDHWREVGRR